MLAILLVFAALPEGISVKKLFSERADAPEVATHRFLLPQLLQPTKPCNPVIKRVSVTNFISPYEVEKQVRWQDVATHDVRVPQRVLSPLFLVDIGQYVFVHKVSSFASWRIGFIEAHLLFSLHSVVNPKIPTDLMSL